MQILRAKEAAIATRKKPDFSREISSSCRVPGDVCAPILPGRSEGRSSTSRIFCAAFWDSLCRGGDLTPTRFPRVVERHRILDSPEFDSLALRVRRSACCRSDWRRATSGPHTGGSGLADGGIPVFIINRYFPASSCIPRKMISPSPGVSILSLNSLNPRPTPSEAILLSISRFDDCASVRCASRMQTASVPRSAWHVSTSNSPKKCDFPEPRPP